MTASNIVRVVETIVIIKVPEYIFATATIRLVALVVVDNLIMEHIIIIQIEDMP